MYEVGCVCGHPRKRPTTRREVVLLSRLRGHTILLCPLCRHEIETPRTVRQLRKVSAFGLCLAHAACVRANGLKRKKPEIPSDVIRTLKRVNRTLGGLREMLGTDGGEVEDEVQAEVRRALGRSSEKS